MANGVENKASVAIGPPPAERFTNAARVLSFERCECLPYPDTAAYDRSADALFLGEIG
jgi:hypothetical protein